MRTAWRILVAVGLLLTWAWNTAAAQQEGPTMAIIAGFDGYCRQDGWCPVYVVLSNEGTDVEGELRVSAPGTGSVGRPPDIYLRHVVLPAHSRKAYFLYVPYRARARQLDVQLVAGTRVLATQELSLRNLDEEDRLYGIVSSNPSALNFLSDVAPAGGQGAVAHLSLETLPPDPLGWEGLDVLVLNDVDTTALDADQRQALATWLSHGGHLIVGGGAGAAQTAAGVADLLPVTVQAVRTVDTLDGLGEVVNGPVATGPYPVAEVSLREGQALIQQDDLILVARREVGAGTVDFLAFDAGLNPFTQWEHNAQLWRFIVETETAHRQRLAVRDSYSAGNAIAAIPGLRPPSVLQILAFLLAYTVLIGPVNYLVLRKLDRRELAWLTIPALVLGFTTCAYLTGFQIRGRAPILHRLAVVYVPEETNTGCATELVGLFSPQRARYDVQVQTAGIRSIPGDDYSRPSPSMHVVEEAQTWTVTDLRVDVGGIQSFLVEGYVETTPPETSLQVAVDERGRIQVNGTIQNGSLPLSDAILLIGVGVSEHPLGDLEPGQVVTDIGAARPSRLFGTFVRTGIYPVPSWDDPEQYRRDQLLAALFPSDQPRPAPGVYLVGWSDEAPLDVTLAGRSSTASDVALYIFELPVGPLESEEVILIPSTLITREIEETSGYVNVTDDHISIGGGAAVVFRFSVWSEAMVSRVYELILNLDTSGHGGSSLPEVALWNWENERWEQQPAGWGDNAIPNSGRYVHPDGTVRMRLEVPENQYIEMEGLTITIKGQR